MKTDREIELEKKLAEQQALFIRHIHCDDCVMWEVGDGVEELTKLIAQAKAEQKEEDAKICEVDWQVMKDTESAHYRLTPEPFNPHDFGFNVALIRKLKDRAEAIRNAPSLQ